MTTPRGVALLEVLVALTVLSVLGLAATELTISAIRIVDQSSGAAEEHRTADDFLTAVTFWSPAELDQRLGERPQGEWLLSIERGASSLYRVVLRRAEDRSVLLTTYLYRPSEGS